MGFLKKANFHAITNLEDDEREREQSQSKRIGKLERVCWMDIHACNFSCYIYLFIYFFHSVRVSSTLETSLSRNDVFR